MARYVRVSAISMLSGLRKHAHNFEEAVRERMDYWRMEIDKVLPDKPDIILLTEYCDSPSMNISPKEEIAYYQYRGDRILDFFMETARNNGMYIAYPAYMEEAGVRRNTTRIIDRSGHVVGLYHKNHLVTEEMTEYGMICGSEASLIECDFGTVGPVICYDLNFDRIRMQYVRLKPDLLLFSSYFHGGLMQRYWAYSCRAYFVGSVLDDACSVIAPTGEVIASGTNYFNNVTANLNLDSKLAHFDCNREKFQALKSKYGTGVKFSEPGHLGSVLISNEMEAVTVEDLFKEFEIECLDDYFHRAQALQQEFRGSVSQTNQ